MKRKRFIKIMQSKGLQRNEAEKLAKEVLSRIGEGLSYELISRGSVTKYPHNSFALKYSDYDAILIGKAFDFGSVKAYRSAYRNMTVKMTGLGLYAPSERDKQLSTQGCIVPCFGI